MFYLKNAFHLRVTAERKRKRQREYYAKMSADRKMAKLERQRERWQQRNSLTANSASAFCHSPQLLVAQNGMAFSAVTDLLFFND